MNAQQAGDRAVHRWAMPRWWRPFVVGIMAVMLMASPIVAVKIIAAEGPLGLVFMAALFGALAWNVYWWCFRIAHRLELRDETLHWRALFAGGSIPVASITGVGRFLGLSNQVPTIRAVGHRSVPVFAYGDLSSFLAGLNTVNTAVPDRVRGFGGLYDRITGPGAPHQHPNRSDD